MYYVVSFAIGFALAPVLMAIARGFVALADWYGPSIPVVGAGMLIGVVTMIATASVWWPR
jgi:hypothetical protein